MTKEEVKKILEKQLQLLSEASEKEKMSSELAQLTTAIISAVAIWSEF